MEWFNIIEKEKNGVYALVQEGYVGNYGARDGDIAFSWQRADAYRIDLRLIKDDKFYGVRRIISQTLVSHKRIFEDRLFFWMGNFLKYMSRNLTIDDFIWITVDSKKGTGYYSFKGNGYEITIDFSYCYGWLVCLCNKWEEVIEQYACRSSEVAVEKANEIYCSFATTQPISFPEPIPSIGPMII